MSLLCKLVDHTYGNVSTKEKIDERNGQKTRVKIRTKKCSRCGYQKEERFRTIVESDEDIDSEESSDSEESLNSTDVQQLDTDNKPTKNENNRTVQHSKELRDEVQRNSSGDDGVIILKENKRNQDNNSQTKQKSVKVQCQGCDYEEIDKEKHRRSGDFCPECGGWLVIED